MTLFPAMRLLLAGVGKSLLGGWGGEEITLDLKELKDGIDQQSSKGGYRSYSVGTEQEGFQMYLSFHDKSIGSVIYLPE